MKEISNKMGKMCYHMEKENCKMAGKKICIMTDCACDLPENILKMYDINVIYFYIETERGRFRDIDEITSENVFEYLMSDGKRTKTSPPKAEEFIEYFVKKLGEYDEIIHIAISSQISKCVEVSTKAAKQMGILNECIHIFDSKHLSTGAGLLVIRAAKMAKAGSTTKEILSELETMHSKVSTTFMVQDLDYLYRNGMVSRQAKMLCSMFKVHPVLEMRDGFIKLKSIQIGDYEKSTVRYIKKQLKHVQKIQNNKLFITYAGCSVHDLKIIRQEVDKYISFDSIMKVKASATISVNCGPRTFGLFILKK